MSRAVRLAQRAKNIFAEADLDGRELSGDERRYVQELLHEAKEVADAEREIDEIGRALGPPGESLLMGGSDGWHTNHTGGPGDVFVQSKGFRQVADPGARPQIWSTGAIEVPPFRISARRLVGLRRRLEPCGSQVRALA